MSFICCIFLVYYPWRTQRVISLRPVDSSKLTTQLATCVIDPLRRHHTMLCAAGKYCLDNSGPKSQAHKCILCQLWLHPCCAGDLPAEEYLGREYHCAHCCGGTYLRMFTPPHVMLLQGSLRGKMRVLLLFLPVTPPLLYSRRTIQFFWQH